MTDKRKRAKIGDTWQDTMSGEHIKITTNLGVERMNHWLSTRHNRYIKILKD